MADTGCLHGMLSTPFGRGESGTRVFGLSRITKPIDGSLFMGTWRGLLRKTIPVCDEVSVPTQGVWSNIARKFAGLEKKAPVAMYVSPRIEACCLDCLRIPRNFCRQSASSGIGQPAGIQGLRCADGVACVVRRSTGLCSVDVAKRSAAVVCRGRARLGVDSRLGTFAVCGHRGALHADIQWSWSLVAV